MSRFILTARESLALSNYTPAVRTVRVALGLGLSLAIHAAAWLGIQVAPPAPAKQRAVITATLVAPAKPSTPIFMLPPYVIEPPAHPSEPPPLSEEPPLLTPPGALEFLPSGPEEPAPQNVEKSAQIMVNQPDAVFYSAGEVDRGAAFITDVQPDYPAEAHFRGVEGYVDIRVYIDEAGFVRDIRVDTAEPAGFFEEAAIAAFRTAKFAPAYKNDRPVKSQKKIRVTFGLTEGASQ